MLAWQFQSRLYHPSVRQLYLVLVCNHFYYHLLDSHELQRLLPIGVNFALAFNMGTDIEGIMDSPIGQPMAAVSPTERQAVRHMPNRPIDLV